MRNKKNSPAGGRQSNMTDKPPHSNARKPYKSPSSPQPDRHAAGGRPKASLPLINRDGYFLYGRNSVLAALANPNRECVHLICTQGASADLVLPEKRKSIRRTIVEHGDELSAAIPAGSPHQGVLLEVRPLAGIPLDTLTPLDGQKNIILMLDQVTDPQNVGACIRSAAAFGARAIITQDRNSPQETGTLARASAGAVETLPWVQVTNLSQALDTLKDMGYWHVGLDGDTKLALRDLKMGDNIVIVMGSEGSGLRPLVRKNCDAVARIPMSGAVESLNVSNAAAIALYELSYSPGK